MCRAVVSGTSPRVLADDVEPVTLTSDGNFDPKGPMIAAWHRSRWYFGHGVTMNQDNIPEEKIIRYFKLLLYDDHMCSPQAKHVQEQLQNTGKSLEDLLAAFLRYIWRDVETEFHGRYTNLDQSNCRTRVYLSVPKLVTFQASEQLIDAAKAAGLPAVTLVYEPMCAGARIIERMVRHPQFYHKDISNYVSATQVIHLLSMLTMLDRI